MEAFRFHLIQTAIYSVKLVGWQQDLKGSAEGHVKYAGRSGSSHGTSSDLTRQGGSSKGFSAQELKDFRDAMDVVGLQPCH
ncbi:conjugal transfer mating pair stabilization protein TraG [Escherichia coli]|uniref:Conjugal transfer mating pair stabilization protein TraG n=1 Tax=Escherichia coli TaxID=562 RepID=A0A376TXI8_ECOLX|nr:conjugal transfer mating pair stabilization protein TraG [Escherichia coli]